MILEAFRTLLLADAAVSTAVGTKVYPLVIPQTVALPVVVLQVVNTTPTQTLHETSGMDRVRMQVSIYAETYIQAGDIANKIRAAVDNYTGLAAEVQINRISFDADRDLYETESGAYHKSTDYTLLINK